MDELTPNEIARLEAGIADAEAGRTYCSERVFPDGIEAARRRLVIDKTPTIERACSRCGAPAGEYCGQWQRKEV